MSSNASAWRAVCPSKPQKCSNYESPTIINEETNVTCTSTTRDLGNYNSVNKSLMSVHLHVCIDLWLKLEID